MPNIYLYNFIAVSIFLFHKIVTELAVYEKNNTIKPIQK